MYIYGVSPAILLSFKMCLPWQLEAYVAMYFFVSFIDVFAMTTRSLCCHDDNILLCLLPYLSEDFFPMEITFLFESMSILIY